MSTPDLVAAQADTPEVPYARHVAQRTIVLTDLKILFLPVPKAACTTVLWTLADLAGIPSDRFGQSLMPEVSPALTVHDMSLWEPENKLINYTGEERERILTEDGWLRFGIVRDPLTRVWSAWQSKLLLREPRFVEEFGAADWFPRIPEHPDEIVEDFRRFVAVLLPAGQAEDVHWSIQHDLTSQLPLGHIGRVEALGETLALLRAHVGEQRWPTAEHRANRTPLSLPPHAYDEAALAVVRERYSADGDAFGYDLTPRAATPADESAWADRVAPLLSLVRETIDEHRRVGQMHKAANDRLAIQREQREQREATQKANRRAQPTTSRSPWLPNQENDEDFDVHWGWAEEAPLQTGFTAVLRVKNEAASLPWVLPQLLRAARHIVIVDNGSTDGTGEVAQAVAAEHGAEDRLSVHPYPFAVARCGDEHLGTPADSVHSLAYFYNWSFAHVRTTYALKWDGDMVLTDAAVAQLRDLAWQLEAAPAAVIRVPRYPLYLADDRHAFLDVGLRNFEPWGWPNRPGYSFVKAMDWELPMWGEKPRSIVLPSWGCFELKHLDADEFAHWSHTDFDASARTARKLREWQVFQALTQGAEPPKDVVAIEAPAGTHVIDHVRDVVLPERSRAGAGR